MAGFQPVVMVGGQFEQVGDRRCEVLRLNIGPATSIFVTGLTFSITTSCHRIFNTTGSHIVATNILGGVEGDLIFLFSGGSPHRVRLQNGAFFVLGTNNFDLQGINSIVLYRTAINWEEVSRKV